MSIPNFYSKKKYSKVLTGDLHEASTGPSCDMSQGPNDGKF